ncbi:MAG: DUF1801 domain-containing protein [SAR202 cluster bacterium]|nr:DUF1801 domain-containing protein [SAR202 cluster bacterium]
MPRSRNVDSWMAEQDPGPRIIAEALRNLLLDAYPQIKETVKWGQPVYVNKGNVFYLAATHSYATLGFMNGAAIEDSSGRIEGTGKNMRHVKVSDLDEIEIRLFLDWIHQAMELDDAGAKGAT